MRVIVDTDVGDDDVFAITMLLAACNKHDSQTAADQLRPEIEAVTTVQGIKGPKEGAETVRRLFATLNPVYLLNAADDQEEVASANSRPRVLEGLSASSVQGGHSFREALWWDECVDVIDTFADLCGFVQLGEDSDTSVSASSVAVAVEVPTNEAVEFLCRRVQSGPALSLLLLGPLTNIAAVVKRVPLTQWTSVDRIVVMGGQVRAAGNNNDGTAEWNFYADAQAVSVVLDGLRAAQDIQEQAEAIDTVHVPDFILAGLEVANDQALERDLQLMAASVRNKEVESAHAMCAGEVLARAIRASEYACTYDAVASALLFRPSLFQTEHVHVTVRTTVGANEGRLDEHLARTANSARILLATDMDKIAFEHLIKHLIAD